MVELPAQVKRQLEEIEAFDRQANAALEAAGAPDPQSSEPEAPPAATETPLAPAPASPAAGEDWEAKYKTLQGMFNGYKARSETATADLNRKVDGLVAQLAKPPEPPTQVAHEPLVTSKDVEAFGGDLLDVVKRQAQEVASEALKPVMTENATLKAELAAIKAQTATTAKSAEDTRRQTFWAALAAQVPDYAAINDSEPFHTFLAEVDPTFGLSRQQGLENAFDNFDADRTAFLFKQFLAAQAPPTAAPPAPKSKLERLVQPNVSKSTPVTPSADDNTRTWTTAEIDTFYRQVAQGKMVEADKVRIEASIDLALQQGRIAQ